MFYLLFRCKGIGIGQTDKVWREFNTEKGLLEFLTDNFKTEGFKVHKILKEAEEYEIKYALHLQPVKRSAARKIKKEGEEAIVPIPEKPDPGMIDRQDKETKEAGRKCSSCGAEIKPWSKTGKCTPCQLGKKKSKK